MKIEKLTENKIRIIIALDELSEKNINLHTLAQNNLKANSLFKQILDEAEKQVGFVVKDCKLLIEAFSTSEGAVVFTLTKYKNESSTKTFPKKLRYKRKEPCVLAKNAIYEFNSFDEFCNFCTYCKSSKLSDLKSFAKNISLYEYNSLYYLSFLNINSDFENSTLFYASISEFAKMISNSTSFKSKMDEHGKVIFKTNAIKNGIKYFVNN